MKINSGMAQSALGICLALLLTTVYASDKPLNLTLPSAKFYTQETEAYILAQNQYDDASTQSASENIYPAANFKPPLFSASKIHQYLGIGTIALAGLTALSHPEECEESNCANNASREVNGRHATLAKATVAMAAATIAMGLYAHWDDFNLADGFADPDNLHVMLAVTGAALMAYAVNLSANSSTPVNHAGIAEAGALGMVVAIKLNW